MSKLSWACLGTTLLYTTLTYPKGARELCQNCPGHALRTTHRARELIAMQAILREARIKHCAERASLAKYTPAPYLFFVRLTWLISKPSLRQIPRPPLPALATQTILSQAKWPAANTSQVACCQHTHNPEQCVHVLPTLGTQNRRSVMTT